MDLGFRSSRQWKSRRLVSLPLAAAMAAVLGGAAAAGGAGPAAPAAAPPAVTLPAPLRVIGVRLDVPDLERAVAFYTGVLGFELGRRRPPDEAELRSGPVPVVLHRVESAAHVDYPRDVETHLNFQVKDLDQVVAEMRRQNVDVLDPKPETAAIGKFTSVKDPAGNVIHLMQLNSPSPGLAGPAMFNVGIKVTDMALARSFYCQKLGFEVFSEDYYPPTVPLKKVGVIALTLHDNATAKVRPGYPRVAETIVRLGTEDLAAARAELARRGIAFLPAAEAGGGRPPAEHFADPFGNVIELVGTPRAGGAEPSGAQLRPR